MKLMPKTACDISYAYDAKGRLASAVPVYHYYLQDHLGNNRVVVNQNDSVEQVNHYYPFGALFGESTGGDKNRYKYNGKELDRLHGLDWYDYGARWHDAALGRWATVDPMAEKYYSLSPYNYCGNNPVNAIDPRGDTIIVMQKDTQYKYINGKYYNSNGTEYSGKISGFMKKVSGAMSELQKSKTGIELINNLSSSSFTFTIIKGRNHFETNTINKATRKLVNPDIKDNYGEGGKIFWDPNNTNGGPNINGGTYRPSYIGLGHEMGHAEMSRQGLSNLAKADVNSPYPELQNITMDEYNAMRYENQIRKELEIPLRAAYSVLPNGDFFMPIK